MTFRIFARFTLKHAAYRTACWSYFVVKWLVLKTRFMPLSLPFFRTQFIFDRLTRRIIKLRIRDSVDYAVFHQIFLRCDYQFKFNRRKEIDSLYNSMVVAGRTPLIIDCGANIGMSARYFKETYPHSKLVGIEPEKGNFELAKSNNDLHTEFMLAGIGCHHGRANIISNNSGNWAYRTELSDFGTVEIVSVNKILIDNYTCTPFIIKIDIEGFESNLFSDNTEWVDKFPVLVIELHDWMISRAGISSNFLREISKLNRDFLFEGENVFSISNTLM